MGEYLGMSYSLKVKRFFIALALVLTSSMSAFASENVISSVIISKSKVRKSGGGDGYDYKSVTQESL